MDVQARPEARQELDRLGVPLVPAVAVGDRVVHGWNPEGYAALLGVDWRPAPALAPAELAARLDRVLAVTADLVRALPDDRLGYTPPERARTLGDLAWHVFRLSLAFVEAMERNELPESWLGEGLPGGVTTAGGIADFGQSVRARLAGWMQTARPEAWARVVRVYYGPQSGHQLLERTAWHAAQHLRQLYELAGRLGVSPPEPLPVETLAGLPVPDALW